MREPICAEIEAGDIRGIPPLAQHIGDRPLHRTMPTNIDQANATTAHQAGSAQIVQQNLTFLARVLANRPRKPEEQLPQASIVRFRLDLVMGAAKSSRSESSLMLAPVDTSTLDELRRRKHRCPARQKPDDILVDVLDRRYVKRTPRTIEIMRLFDRSICRGGQLVIDLLHNKAFAGQEIQGMQPAHLGLFNQPFSEADEQRTGRYIAEILPKAFLARERHGVTPCMGDPVCDQPLRDRPCRRCRIRCLPHLRDAARTHIRVHAAPVVPGRHSVLSPHLDIGTEIVADV
ncbi:hypothetical protein GALL_471310 [mine drainage metagenome]|uniref:Uncharacterized protein n=1 Tax=mine drainage metagenome TaxID=410659 RepID=A0A1J5PIE1_9ZZZZ